MSEAPSMLSIAAAAFYGFVMIASLAAGYVSRAQRQQGWHTNAWVVIAVLFAVLIISRLFSVEEVLRADLRDWLRSEDMVDDRRIVQGWIIAGVIGLFAAAGLYTAYWISRRIKGRRNIAVAIAVGSGGIMLLIIALRTISLHAMDRLLYGALKLNWVGDLGSSAAIIAAAAYYVWLIRQPPRQKAR